MTVSFAGSTVSVHQLKELFTQIASGSVRSEHMQAFLDHRDPFTKRLITVSSNSTLTERIAAGAYDWVNSDIDNGSRFPHNTTTVGTFECDLYNFGEVNSSEYTDDIYSSAEVDGWQLAHAEHLFAFGAAYPDEQRTFFIGAPGSVFVMQSRYRCVLMLLQEDGKRVLDYHPYQGNWGPMHRFLRVRKVHSLAG